MIAIITSSIISAFLFLISGTAFSKLFGLSNSFVEKILTGLVVINVITTLCSLFAAINQNVLAYIFLACVCLLFYIRTESAQLLALVKQKIVIILLSSPFILLAFLMAVGPPLNWDTGLYHLQSIKWIEQYPVIPGLANLHGRFGFNPNIFTVFSLTSFSTMFGQEIFSINFVLFSIFVLHFVNKLYLTYKEESISNFFIFNAVVFSAVLSLSNNISSPSPDFVALSFTLFILSGLVKSSFCNTVIGKHCYPSVLLLSLYIFTVKLATVPILLLAFFLVFKNKPSKLQLLGLASVAFLIFMPWLVRNVMLSGWLIYPLPMFNVFDVDWKVQQAQVELEKLLITGFARSHGLQNSAAYYMGVTQWFPLWWNGLIRIEKILFLSAIVSPILILYNYFRSKKQLDSNTIAVTITSFLGVVFWFVLAPDFRFGKSFVVLSAITLLNYYKFKIQFYWEPNYKKIVGFYLFISMLVFFFGRANDGLNVIRIAKQNTGNFITPKKMERLNNLTFKSYTIGTIKVFVPSKEDRCFDHPLPCTGYADTSLQMRGVSILSGFKNGIPKM